MDPRIYFRGECFRGTVCSGQPLFRSLTIHPHIFRFLHLQTRSFSSHNWFLQSPYRFLVSDLSHTRSINFTSLQSQLLFPNPLILPSIDNLEKSPEKYNLIRIFDKPFLITIQ